ncbi:MAG: lysophospholipase [Pseudomonadales bacterium]|uniref:Acylglycerol lipase n=1 Tax=Oleiphilus messinensis TaxID=141451 RepID=A0A1Y0IF48_9GAMM|nr:alpha/beta hydrolase [Oleiphilus messinensis]ARU59167.1 acylglycerol lipase [Oleiphilus messinensis]MCG8614075.1 lysophospholipase [Pseudomonadales bacterium]
MTTQWQDFSYTSVTGHHCWGYHAGGTRGTILFLHGWGDHGERYRELGEQFHARGFAVVLPDLPGHGRSAGPRARVERFSDLVGDCLRILETLNITEPVWLNGHSMGGCLAFHLALQYPERVKGVIFNSAALTINPAIQLWKRMLSRLLGRHFPHLKLATLKQAWMMSQCPIERERYCSDPLIYHGKIEAGTGLELMNANGYVADNMANFRHCFLALQGAKDALVNPEGPERLHRIAGVEGAELCIYPEARHDLLHDLESPAVMRKMLEWMEDQCPALP